MGNRNIRIIKVNYQKPYQDFCIKNEIRLYKGIYIYLGSLFYRETLLLYTLPLFSGVSITHVYPFCLNVDLYVWTPLQEYAIKFIYPFCTIA